jgi:4-amino-4-deoxy-L-arabinose transferase-like glycosyltransferase
VKTRDTKVLKVILLVALVLRLAAAFSQDARAVYHNTGGDSGWYLANGYALVSGLYTGQVVLPGVPNAPTPIYLPNVPTAPLYLIFVGIMQYVFSPEGAVVAIRVIQAVAGTATVFFVYGMAQAVSGYQKAGLVAAAVTAISPVFILECAQVLTETLYIFFLCAGLWAYIQCTQLGLNASTQRSILALSGGLLGLATLTRAVLIVFPLGLAFHLALVWGWRRGLKRAALLLSSYAAVALIWTVFNLLAWNQWVIGAQGFAAFLYLGSTNAGWQGPTQADAALAQQAGGALPTDPNQQQNLYQDSALHNITGNLSGWLALRAGKLSAAYLQPHGTTFFPGESLKELAAAWWTHDRTLNGLAGLTAGEAFWPKVVIYLFHYVGLLAGLIGMALTWRKWRITLPLIGFVVYTSLIHFVLDASPRYLFPMEAIWWAFAAAALYALGRRKSLAKLFQRRQTPVQESVGVMEDVTRV